MEEQCVNVMSMSSVNVAIIGMGKMGILHAGILEALDSVEVKAVAEKDHKLQPHYYTSS